MTKDAWVEVDERLGELAASGSFSGSALVTRGDEVLLETCHGWADRAHGEPIHPGTRFGLASMCKMFTAAAVLDAVRRGEVAVGDRVVDVLPAQRRPSTLADEVTVHHLLTHTSGIGDYAEEDEDLPHYVADYGSLWVQRPCYAMERPDDFLPMYADLTPIGPPGGDFHYCNAGYVLLGAVLEQVTGTPFVDAVTERVLVPAGMADSGYLRSDEPAPDVATGYLPRSSDDAPWRSNVFSVPVVGGGDGGALATARDIDRFLRAIKDCSLLGEEMTALMLTPYVPILEGLDMGYGVMLRPGGTFGHGGGDPGVN
ncbi:beta-lactamase family protein, partial [Tessaracoccus sp. SD287]|uniref:serine hydrolase domain-containing protein n=1 Tax=Tessaracoccus sp. SD287 TaxID=2782008 RepID=UPI001A9731FF